MTIPPVLTGYPFKADCVREGCTHSSSNHSIDDSKNLGPEDPGIKFRCQLCSCPDMIRSQQNLEDINNYGMPSV